MCYHVFAQIQNYYYPMLNNTRYYYFFSVQKRFNKLFSQGYDSKLIHSTIDYCPLCLLLLFISLNNCNYNLFNNASTVTCEFVVSINIFLYQFKPFNLSRTSLDLLISILNFSSLQLVLMTVYLCTRYRIRLSKIFDPWLEVAEL